MVTLYQMYLAYKIGKTAYKFAKKYKQINLKRTARNRKAMPSKKQCGKGWCN